MINNILLVHLALCFFMTGLIWMVQLVHYPSFRYINMSNFTNFTSFHGRSIAPITAIPMILELLTGALLLFYFQNLVYSINFALLLLVWISTFFISVPLHKKLLVAHNTAIIEKLILTNWPRTALWTTRSCLLLWVVAN